MTIGWAIIGAGKQADTKVAPAITAAADSILVGVNSRDRSNAQAFAARHGGAFVGDLDDVLNRPDVTAVYVGTPNGTHASIVRQALTAGKHVLCDKPLATSVDDAVELLELAYAKGLKLGVCFQLRHHPAHQAARHLVEEGRVGAVISAEAHAGSFGAASSWRTHRELATAGVLYDQGVHLIDLLRYVLGAEPIEVTALSDRTAREWLDTTCLILLRFPKTVAYVSCDHRMRKPKRTLEIFGTEGTVGCSGTTDFTWPVAGREDVMQISTVERSAATTYDVPDLLRLQLEDFNRAIVDDREPNASALDGLRCVETAVAVLRALDTGASQTLQFTQVKGMTPAIGRAETVSESK